MNLEEFKKGMAILTKSFPSKDMDFEIMWAFLKDIPVHKFLKAIEETILEEKNINAATNMVAYIREKALVNQSLTAEQAWCEVLGEIRRVGSWGEPRFNDDVTAQSVRCIGWKEICGSETIGVERAHFFRAYEGLIKRRHHDQVTVPALENDVYKLIGNNE
jgi:hypothetical protein